MASRIFNNIELRINHLTLPPEMHRKPDLIQNNQNIPQFDCIDNYLDAWKLSSLENTSCTRRIKTNWFPSVE